MRAFFWESSRKPPRTVLSQGAVNSKSLPHPTSSAPVLQRKSVCACGGNCPRCKNDPPTVQAKINTLGDHYEQEADRVAEQVMQAPESQTIHKELGVSKLPRGPLEGATNPGAPPIVNDVLRSAGQPLDDSTAGDMESRFNHDFGNVRVHTDSTAAQSAGAINALAYTAGSDVVFGAGQYQPGTTAGRRLLAHELTHVVQQNSRGASGVTIQRDKPKAGVAPATAPATPPKFYQYVIDEIAKQEADYARQLKEKQYAFMVIKEMNYNALKALLPLAEAVDQGRAPDIPKLVDAFIKADLGPPFAALSQQLLIDLVARLFTLGLDAEGTKLRENYSQHEKQWDWIKRDVGLAYRNIAIMDAIIDRVAAAADHSTALTTKAVIEQYVKVLVPLRDEMLSMDEMERKEDSTGFRPAPIPGKERWAGLVKILGKLTGAMATSIQSLMDRAASELGTGKADEGKATLLIARELIETKILPGLTSADGKKTIGDIKVVIVPTEITDGQGVIRDAFTKGRAVAVSAYTPKQKFVRDLEAPVQHVFARRIDQITTMAQIFGQSDLLRADKPDEKDRVADAAKNAETLKKIFAAGGQLRLESDDDWRAFVVQKYKDMTGTDAKDKATAFRAVIKLLYDYLEAFTVHARFTDIYDQADFKDAYFNRPFPRTLSGQLVHDCGVYAMRVAYILSLVRDELGLQFRFIRLPAHVGLIITGKDMPTFIAHNDHFKEYSPGEIQDLKDQLVAKNIAPADDDQFIGELAAVHFIEGPLDMPFVLSDVPKPGKTDIATQQSLWKEYQKVAKTDVFGPASSDKKSKGFLFHNRYLAITESYREWHNQSLVPFWNVTAPNSWDTFEKALKAGGRTELLGRELLLLLDAHLKEIDSGLSSVNSRLEGIESSEKAIGVQLRGDPKLPGKGTRITTGGRFVLIHAWQEYRDRVATLKADAAAKLDKPFKVAAVIDPGLVPPFIPIAEKFLVIVD